MSKKSFAEKCVDAGLDVRAPEDLIVEDEAITAKDYLAAMITFLNRAQQGEKALTYPVTKVQLYSRMSAENPEGHPIRTFVVEGDHWKEIKQ